MDWETAGAASIFRDVGVLAADEGPDAGQAHDGEHDAEGSADVAEALAGGFAGGDAPLGGEEPDAVGEVPADGDHGDDVDGEHPGVGELHAALWRRRRRDAREADAHEALASDVLGDVGEGDEAGVALGGVHPVAGPGVVDDVRLAAQPDLDAVEGVIEDGQKDEDPLQHADQGQAVEELDLGSVGEGAFEGLEVGEEVLEQEGADGDDAEQGVELAPEKGGSLAGAQGLDAAPECGRGRLLGSGHGICQLLEAEGSKVSGKTAVSLCRTEKRGLDFDSLLVFYITFVNAAPWV